MKKNQGSALASLCAVTTLLIIQCAARRCMRKYGR